jgi:hypothetical protein
MTTIITRILRTKKAYNEQGIAEGGVFIERPATLLAILMLPTMFFQ